MEVIQNNNTAPQGENLSLWGYFVRCITKKYSDFSGRARRKEWWSFALFELLITSLLGIPVGENLWQRFRSRSGDGAVYGTEPQRYAAVRLLALG